MLKTCLAIVGTYVAASVALAISFFAAFPEAPPDTSPRLPPAPVRASVATTAGFGCGIPALLAIGGLDGARRYFRDRRRVLRGRKASDREDGAIEAFVGRLVATGAPLPAPLSGRPCILYHYAATHASSGRSKDTVTDAEGYGLTRCQIETASGRYDICTYLEPEFEADAVTDYVDGRARLEAYLQTVTVHRPGHDRLADYRQYKAQRLDDDGEIRFDFGRENGLEWATSLAEHVLQDGDEVAIFGMYSAERYAVVPDQANPLVNVARVRKGDPRTIAGGLILPLVLNAIVGLMFLGVTVGLVGLFFQHGALFF